MTTSLPEIKSLLIAVAMISYAAFSTGCSTAGAHQAFTYRKMHSNPHPEKVLTYSYDPAQSTPAQPFFKAAYAGSGYSNSVRNRILYELMGMVDDYYYRYTFELRADISGKNIFTDTLGLGTSLASTAAGAKELKTVLSAISTAAQGVSKSIDSNVLLGNTIQAVRLQMDAARADIATEMIKKMKEQGTTEYPLEAGLRDIIRYYDAGTLTSGLANLSKESGKDKANAEAKQKAKATNEQLSTLPAL